MAAGVATIGPPSHPASSDTELDRLVSMLNDAALLARLPDKGAKLRARCDERRRDTAAAAASEIPRAESDDVTLSNSLPVPRFVAESIPLAVLEATARRHADDRIAVKDWLTISVGSQLSQRELARLGEEAGGLLLTWNETQAMLRSESERSRRALLRQIRTASGARCLDADGE